MKAFVPIFILCGVVAIILAAQPPPRDGPPECLQACDKVLEPVCAQDAYGRNRTYPSRCMLGYLNCKERTRNQLIAEGECPDDPFLQGDEEFDQEEDQ